MSDGYIKHRVTIGGTTLLMHNGQTADPLNKFAKAMKAVSGKRKKTETDYEELARIEYEAGLYLNSKSQVILPSRVLEAHICEAARKSKEGKQALAGLFVDNDAILNYEGGPMTVKQLIASDAHRLVVGVRVQQSRVMRTRPLFTDWTATFDVSLLADAANSDSLKQWLVAGGVMVGLGDYRPRYGRYDVRKFEVLTTGLKAAA